MNQIHLNLYFTNWYTEDSGDAIMTSLTSRKFTEASVYCQMGFSTRIFVWLLAIFGCRFLIVVIRKGGLNISAEKNTIPISERVSAREIFDYLLSAYVLNRRLGERTEVIILFRTPIISFF